MSNEEFSTIPEQPSLIPQQGSGTTASEPQDQGVDATEFASFKNLLLAVVIVLLIMVAQMVIESWNNKNSSYENLSNQIIEQKVKTDLLYQLLKDQGKLELASPILNN